MEKLKKFFSRPWATYAGAACCAVALYMLLLNVTWLKGVLGGVWNFVSPIITGVIVAYLFDPLAMIFERRLLKKVKKPALRRSLSVILTIACTVIVLALLLLALLPSLAKSISKLISNWSSYTAKIEALIDRAVAIANSRGLKIESSGIKNAIDNSMDSGLNFVKGNYKMILGKVGQIGSGISNFAIGVLFGFCFLFIKDTLLGLISKLRAAFVPKEKIFRHNELYLKCHKVFIRYVGCTLLDALIVGVLTLIFTLACGMPYAPLIAAVVAVTNIIPTFGPMIGNLVGVFFIILESPIKALIFFIFICVLQSVDGMIIKTKLFSGSLGIPGVWTMILIILGGKVAGIFGIILAIPFAAIFVIVYRQTIAPKLEARAAKLNAGAAKDGAENEKDRL